MGSQNFKHISTQAGDSAAFRKIAGSPCAPAKEDRRGAVVQSMPVEDDTVH